nr:unnamed protein product [Callosobruchus chinensis]
MNRLKSAAKEVVAVLRGGFEVARNLIQ